MSLFDSITGPRWQHRNPQVRKEAVEELDDQDILLQLATTDPDPGVQSAALARISNPDTLDGLIESLPQSLQPQARRQRLRQLLPAADRLGEIKDDAILERIISLADDEGLLAKAIACISSNAVRMQIAGSHPVAKVRLSAAQAIENIEVLSELMQRAKGHDKAVFRHCKTLVDEHQAREREAAETRQKIQRLCDQAKTLAAAAHSAEYESNYRGLVAQWRAVKDYASPAQQQQFQSDQARCAKRLVQLADARAAEEQAKAELAAARKQFPAILSELQQIDEFGNFTQDVSSLAQLADRLDQLESRWQEATKAAPASVEQTRVCRESLQLWRSMLQTAQHLNDRSAELAEVLVQAESVDPLDHQALQQQMEITANMANALPWPETHREHMPEQLAKLQQALTQLKNQIALLDKNQPKHLERLQKGIDVLRSELERNRSAEAGRALARVRGKLKSLAPKQRSRLEQELQPLAARLKEADDWRKFAVEPKKEALCARMNALIGSDEDVEVLAARIAALQEEWKQLGTLPHARGQALWNEFKSAADKAWEPCKEAFEKQAELRRKNFEQRMALVAQLIEYEQKMDWPQPTAGQDQPASSMPDWRLVQKTLDTARAAFRQINPVDQKADRISRKAFRKICDRIYGHIKQEYGRNIALKEQLLTQARELVELEDLPLAIESSKKLQRQWKAVGITPAGIDRKLWKGFRGACDAVFRRLDEQRAEQSAALDARVKQAEALRDQARALVKSRDEPELHRAVSGMNKQFREIDLPARVQQRLARDFKAIESEARDVVFEEQRRKQQACWTHLLEKIAACALKSADPENAALMWQCGDDLPEGIEAAALNSWWEQGPSGDADERFRDACIGLEILGELESPAADKEARMNIQMQRLVAGMGRGADQPEPTLEERVNAFLSLRPPRQWAERFCSALRTIKGGGPDTPAD